MGVKTKYTCYSVVVFISICLIVIGGLLNGNGTIKRDIESKLPKGKWTESMGQDSENPIIRVVIKTNGFKHLAHTEVGFQAKNGLVVYAKGEAREINPEEILLLAPDDVMLQADHIKIEAKNPSDKITVTTLKRGDGVPSYYGSFELIATAEGIVLVNELPVETYLYGVVPSEMPATYEMEALKAQAVCARSYAYNQMKSYSYPEYQAHVDDSTSFQVYGNSEEHQNTTHAIDATKGQKVWYQGQVATTYYYSTSCGKTTSMEAWGKRSDGQYAYLKGVEVCSKDGYIYEKNLPWYRWSATIPKKTLAKLIELNTTTTIGTIQNISITKTGAGGVALELKVKGTKGSVTVATENKIRLALGGKGYQIKKQDGTVTDSKELLPSAFFTIEKSGNNYIIQGGGFGHGIGMSQNGANEMAKLGKTYEEILQFFYHGVQVK